VQYAVVRYNGSVIQIMINGGSFDSGSPAGSIGNAGDNPLLLADTGQASNHLFVGSYGDILAYNVAVSDANATLLSNWIKGRCGA
jgi:hypothetical protein